MRAKALLMVLIASVGLTASLVGLAAAQSPAGRWEARSPRFYSVPQTAWVKAELLSDDAVSQQVGTAINAQLRLRGYDIAPGGIGPAGAYALRLELRGRGLSTPAIVIAGYSNATQRLSIWPEPDRPDAIYVSLLLYHQSTGLVLWQGEAVCIGLPPDARNIVNAMVGPLMDRIGSTGKSSLDCRHL